MHFLLRSGPFKSKQLSFNLWYQFHINIIRNAWLKFEEMIRYLFITWQLSQSFFSWFVILKFVWRLFLNGQSVLSGFGCSTFSWWEIAFSWWDLAFCLSIFTFSHLFVAFYHLFAVFCYLFVAFCHSIFVFRNSI